MSTQDDGHRIPLALNRAYIERRPSGSQPPLPHVDGDYNRLARSWAVRHVLYVLIGRAQSVTIQESGAQLGEGIKIVLRQETIEEVHRLQYADNSTNSWTVRSLGDRGLWSEARSHIGHGKSFHVISTLPALQIEQLADRVRKSHDLKSFLDHFLTADLRDSFDQLASKSIFGSAETAWQMLRQFWISRPDEQDTARTNAVLAELLLEGVTGQLAVAAIWDLISNNFGVELDRVEIDSRLVQYGLQRTSRSKTQSFPSSVESINSAWLESVERELLSPEIPRLEATKLADLAAGSGRLFLLTGAAGGGKSATLHQFFKSIDAKEIPLLAFRLDRLDAFSSTTELGEQIGLTVSPVTALASVAGNKASVLIVDQLDAVSLTSGRLPR
ncbi:hypothetical protein ACF1G3_37800, partial [Streptomyces rochei]